MANALFQRLATVGLSITVVAMDYVALRVERRKDPYSGVACSMSSAPWNAPPVGPICGGVMERLAFRVMHLISAIRHARARRAALSREFDVARRMQELEESCVPSDLHPNPLAAGVVASWQLMVTAAGTVICGAVTSCTVITCVHVL